jgi:hypothetical protein
VAAALATAGAWGVAVSAAEPQQMPEASNSWQARVTLRSEARISGQGSAVIQDAQLESGYFVGCRTDSSAGVEVGGDLGLDLNQQDWMLTATVLGATIAAILCGVYVWRSQAMRRKAGVATPRAYGIVAFSLMTVGGLSILWSALIEYPSNLIQASLSLLYFWCGVVAYRNGEKARKSNGE